MQTNPSLTGLLCDPLTRAPLRELDDGRFTDDHGRVYPITAGFPDFRTRNSPLRHRFWGWVYNRVSFGYDLGVRVGWRLALGGAPIERDEYLARIDASPGNRILETAVGTGTNLLALPPGPDTFGLDISHAMLRRCRHRLNRDGRRAALVLADMASAPFADSVFDVVFHMGGLQFASDPLRCIAEMHRMARPGGQVLIVEETASAEVLARRSGVAGLEGLVPEESADVRIDTISGGELVAIEFLVKFRGAESRMPPP